MYERQKSQKYTIVDLLIVACMHAGVSYIRAAECVFCDIHHYYACLLINDRSIAAVCLAALQLEKPFGGAEP